MDSGEGETGRQDIDGCISLWNFVVIYKRNLNAGAHFKFVFFGKRVEQVRDMDCTVVCISDFSKGTTIGKAVKQVMVRAIEQERVHFGIFQCVDILDR